MTKLRVLYKDEDLLVVEKPAGLTVEGDDESIEVAIQKLYDSRARVLHRLDKGTSGVLAISLRRLHHSKFVELWEKRRVMKTYHALVEGSWASSQTKLGGKDSLGRQMETRARLIERGSSHSFLELIPHTGRRHQLRLQCSALGHPIVGDIRYGAKPCAALGESFALHAHALAFRHPVTGEELKIVSATPEVWASLMGGA